MLVLISGKKYNIFNTIIYRPAAPGKFFGGTGFRRAGSGSPRL